MMAEPLARQRWTRAATSPTPEEAWHPKENRKWEN